MPKWAATLSTTEPYNYVGIIKVRQGNINSEKLMIDTIENGAPYDLTGCSIFFEAIVNKYPVQREAKAIDLKSGRFEYTFDEFSMQYPDIVEGAQFVFYKGETLVASTQKFSYFVMQAVSKTESETGSYWQSVEDLLEDMKDYLNANKGDFNSWFDSVKDVLNSIDPGGVLLNEIVLSRKDLSGNNHDSLSERLEADFIYIEQKLKNAHYTLDSSEIDSLILLQDDNFFANHDATVVDTVNYEISNGALVIASIDDQTQNVFKFVQIGVI